MCRCGHRQHWVRAAIGFAGLNVPKVLHFGIRRHAGYRQDSAHGQLYVPAQRKRAGLCNAPPQVGVSQYVVSESDLRPRQPCWGSFFGPDFDLCLELASFTGRALTAFTGEAYNVLQRQLGGSPAAGQAAWLSSLAWMACAGSHGQSQREPVLVSNTDQRLQPTSPSGSTPK